MKFALPLFLAIACSAALADEPWEGDYSNGTVTLTRSVGARGGDEFESTACAGKVFRPRLDPKSSVHIGEDKSYTIVTAPSYKQLTVTGRSPCFPQGTYRKVS